MTSKHHRWQTRWRIDADSGAWVHESGLSVLVPPTGPPVATNGDEVLTALASKHGHNARDMVARLMREAAQLGRTGTHHDDRRNR